MSYWWDKKFPNNIKTSNQTWKCIHENVGLDDLRQLHGTKRKRIETEGGSL